MCMIIKRNQESEILDTDIFIFKYYYKYKYPKSYISPFMSDIVEMGNTYKSDSIRFCEFTDDHSLFDISEINAVKYIFPEFKSSTISLENWNNRNFDLVKTGFHGSSSYSRIKGSLINTDSVIVECIVPAGSKIYKGITDLVVSDTIIPHSVISR